MASVFDLVVLSVAVVYKSLIPRRFDVKFSSAILLQMPMFCVKQDLALLRIDNVQETPFFNMTSDKSRIDRVSGMNGVFGKLSCK